MHNPRSYVSTTLGPSGVLRFEILQSPGVSVEGPRKEMKLGLRASVGPWKILSRTPEGPKVCSHKSKGYA